VQTRPGARLSAEAIQAQLRERIAGYKVPRVVTFHDALPREDSGKIFKRRLREPYWRAAGRKI
jgi:long-chain acyl-CoA synthetase